MTKVKTYQERRAELDDILTQLQQPDCDVETAAELYEQGLKLTTELRQQLEAAENKIQKLAPDSADA